MPGLDVGGDNWSVVAFGRNIGDEKWLQEVIPAPEFGGSFIHPGSRSRYGIEATITFLSIQFKSLPVM